MVCSQDADYGGGLQMWNVTASEQSWSSTVRANNSSLLKISMLTLGWGPVAGSCDYSNEFLHPIKGVKFLKQLNGQQLLNIRIVKLDR